MLTDVNCCMAISESEVENIGEAGNHGAVGGGVFFGGPAFAFEPCHAAADGAGREDVFFERVADNEHLVGLEAEGHYSETENGRVGLADSHDGALDDAFEVAAQVEIAEHGVDVAVEVADEHHGVAGGESFEHGARFGYGVQGGIVAIVGDGPGERLDGAWGEMATVDEPLQLDAHLLEEKVMEIVAGEDVAHTGELTLGEYVGVAEHGFRDGYAAGAVSVPYYFAPVDAAAVDSAAVVENYAFYRFHVRVSVNYSCGLKITVGAIAIDS